MTFETGSQTQYAPDGQRTYNQSGELVTHHGYFETLAAQTAAFTRASTAYNSYGNQVPASVPRYELPPNKIRTEGGGADADWSKWDHWNNITYWYWTTQTDGVFTGKAKASTYLYDYYPYSIESGKTYKLAIFVKADREITGLSARAYIRRSTGGDIVSQTNTINITTEWKLFEWELTPSESNSTVGIGIGSLSLPNGTIIYARNPFLGLTEEYLRPEFGQGVMIEEGTTNLLMANQASVETNISGFGVAGSAVISRDTTNYWHGNASLEVVTSGAAIEEGFTTTAISGLTASQTYTASVWLKGSGTVRLRIREMESSSAVVGDTLSNGIALTNVWTRYSVSRTFGPTGVQSRLQVRTDTTQAITFYADGLQIEQKPYATSWQLPGSARAAELINLPTSVLDSQEGSIEGWFMTNDVDDHYGPILTTIPSAGGNPRLLIMRHFSSNKLTAYDADGTTEISFSVNQVLQPNTIYYFSYRWSTTLGRKLTLNNISVTNSRTAALAASSFTELRLGSFGSNYLNGHLSHLRISNKWRTDDETAAAYATDLPLTVDEYTTYLMGMNGTLQPTIRGFGLWSKNGRHILHDPHSGQGIEVWDDNSLKVLVGLLANGKIGIKANDGEIYSGKFQTGNEDSNTYIALNSNGTLSAYYNGKQTLDMWAGNWGNIVFCEDGNRVGQLYTTNEYDPVLGGTKRRFVVWGTGDGSLRLDGPGIELDSDNVNLARSSSSQISVRGKIWDNLLPAYDLGGFVGQEGLRWHTVRARYITSGDLCFEEESCPICEQPFTMGDTIVLTVHHIHEEHHTMCIPIHETCKDTRKALTVEVPETEKRYRLGKNGQIETYHATKFKEVEEQVHKIKDDYSIDEKTGEFKKKDVDQPIRKDEAVEIITVKSRVPVMKTVKVELNAPANT